MVESILSAFYKKPFKQQDHLMSIVKLVLMIILFCWIAEAEQNDEQLYHEISQVSAF